MTCDWDVEWSNHPSWRQVRLEIELLGRVLVGHGVRDVGVEQRPAPSKNWLDGPEDPMQ